VFRGRIIVAEDAQQTNADQQNNNLILSDKAEADTKPQLEIYADDVQCSHGATVGQLDAKSLFYLRSRGIDLANAQRLLTFAFANEVIERINIEQLSDELTHKLAGQLLDD
jgi:Fe-S cluster assembly protein SufD